jgi:hypothetical protein
MLTGDTQGDDEAEYAWLPYHSIKPFAPGDVCGNETGQAPVDPVLQACVVQAEAALAAANTGRYQLEDGSDSDGGWGVSREVRVAIGSGRYVVREGCCCYLEGGDCYKCIFSPLKGTVRTR